MTRFEELTDIINRNRQKRNIDTDKEQDDLLEVSGLSPNSSNPLIEYGDNEVDPDMIEQLYRNPRSRPERGYTSSWDSNY